MTSNIDRRRLLAGAGAVAGAAALAQVPAETVAAAPALPGRKYPFTLGVASGDPTPSGVVLWTRLAPEPYEPDGGLPATALPVRWQVARDERFRHVVKEGLAWALPQLAHSVHVEVDGLAPDGEWFYRFAYRDQRSPIGRTRTAPARRSPGGRLDLAVVSCQSWDNGYYPSYAHIARDDVDLVLHLGDYVYEGGIGATGGYRGVAVPETARPAPKTLDQWRIRYALYKSDPDLQAAHARVPFAVTWDDHEVVNDYAGTHSQYQETDIADLRAAAYQAWYEHQPVRRLPRIYRRLHWGRLAQLDILDGRQYRTGPACSWGEGDACDAQYAPDVTMLGFDQEKWLSAGLAASSARWNLLGSNVMMARLDHDGDAGDKLWHDAWDGYPAARNRITRAWTGHRVSNPVVLTGDWHSTFVNDIHADFDRPGSPVVATEFVGTSISSNGDGTPYGPYYGPMIEYNPHIRFFDGDRRGHQRFRIDRDTLRMEARMVTTVARRDAPQYTHATFVVESGRPGAHQV
ncbi:alkaline phosphatase D family protein [Actinoplanes sp. NPDC023714]|uniref:alkaline phosphatase D family protein n=1 Tax=Actinoplanes sp. NPDC023714 TaxID=3154322 RepID=UPI00340A5200